MATKIAPIRDRILVRRVEEQDKTAGGIIIPDSAREKPQVGEVIAVGTGKITEDGKVIPLAVKPGDRIMFGKYAGTETPRYTYTYESEGEELLFIREDEILAVLDGTAKPKDREREHATAARR